MQSIRIKIPKKKEEIKTIPTLVIYGIVKLIH